MNIQPTYASLLDVRTIKQPGRPRIIASRIKGIMGLTVPGMIVTI